jgi:hypothetical protein
MNRMRLILQLFYAPAIRTVPEAQAMTARRREATASQRARFAGFAEAAASIHPGLFVPQLNDAVLAVSLPEPPREQVVRLARAATMAGLHMLDPQNLTLYRADGCVVYPNGSVTPMPAPPVAPPLAWSKDAVQALVERRISSRLSAHGFSARPDSTLTRLHGTVQQSVSFFVGEQAGALLGHTRFHFQCRDVWQVWHDALGHADGVTTPDLTLTATELANGRPPSNQGNAWRKLQEVQDWLDAFDHWFDEAALPRLNQIRRAADLAEIALTDTQLEVLPRRGQLTTGERFSRMVMAAAFDADRLPTWANVLCTPRPKDGKVERGQLKQLADFLQG